MEFIKYKSNNILLHTSFMKIKNSESLLTNSEVYRDCMRQGNVKIDKADATSIVEIFRITKYIDTLNQRKVAVGSDNLVIALLCSISLNNLGENILADGYSSEMKSLRKAINTIQVKRKVSSRFIIETVINNVSFDRLLVDNSYKDMAIFAVINLFLQEINHTLVLEDSDIYDGDILGMIKNYLKEGR